MTKKININTGEKMECCGCFACMNICPKNAIKIYRDEQGFDYPVADEQSCVACGLCIKVCNKTLSYKRPVIACFAAKNKDRDVVLSSSSGGIVDALCKFIIAQKGIVYAVSYNENFEVVYKRAEKYEDCKNFRKSKYVQANPNRTFEEIYNDLINKKIVLFVGSSCYVSGLKSYLNLKKCDINNLYTVDFICHGVPSPGIFQEYVAFINEKCNVSDIIFRNKKNNVGENFNIAWKYGKYSCSIIYDDGRREVDSLKSRIYLNLFTSNNCLRPHCYECKYIGTDKSGDITVADYWGIEQEHREFADQFGVSAVMVHSIKGQELFDSCDNINRINSSIESISKKQGMLRSASPKGEQYDKFWNDYRKHDFRYIAKKYGEYSFMGKIRSTKLYALWVKIRYGE